MMGKLVVNKNADVLADDLGILYVILFTLDNKQLVKIGVTSRSIEARVTEILLSIFKTYREFPYCRPKRFSATSDAYSKEAKLHKHFADRRYSTSKKFNGHTEFFDVPLDEVVCAYEAVLKEC